MAIPTVQEFQAELDGLGPLVGTLVNQAKGIAGASEDPEFKKKIADALTQLDTFDHELNRDLMAIRQLGEFDLEGDEGVVEHYFLEKRRETENNHCGVFHRHIEALQKSLREAPRQTQALEDSDDDLQIADTVYSRKDPISKADIVNPVRNKICKHVYDKDSVKKYIADNRARRMLCQCPQMACPNKKQLEMADIEAFPDFFNLVGDA
ncbi:hypothetical protein AAVH_05618 [Aphelenchoides avenae]|nr:hypothetical protein AAVH_05618 [Aphelenchus avenae]